MKYIPIVCHTSDKENAVRYVAGYVVRKIKDALRSPQDKPLLDIFSQSIASPETGITSRSTSQEWTDRTSCGRLISVTDEVFQCLLN